jgi:hypothetical protein
MEVWHERLGVKTVRLFVTGESMTSLDVVYALNQNIR